MEQENPRGSGIDNPRIPSISLFNLTQKDRTAGQVHHTWRYVPLATPHFQQLSLLHTSIQTCLTGVKYY